MSVQESLKKVPDMSFEELQRCVPNLKGKTRGGRLAAKLRAWISRTRFSFTHGRLRKEDVVRRAIEIVDSQQKDLISFNEFKAGREKSVSKKENEISELKNLIQDVMRWIGGPKSELKEERSQLEVKLKFIDNCEAGQLSEQAKKVTAEAESILLDQLKTVGEAPKTAYVPTFHELMMGMLLLRKSETAVKSITDMLELAAAEDDQKRYRATVEVLKETLETILAQVEATTDQPVDKRDEIEESVEKILDIDVTAPNSQQEVEEEVNSFEKEFKDLLENAEQIFAELPAKKVRTRVRNEGPSSFWGKTWRGFVGFLALSAAGIGATALYGRQTGSVFSEAAAVSPACAGCFQLQKIDSGFVGATGAGGLQLLKEYYGNLTPVSESSGNLRTVFRTLNEGDFWEDFWTEHEGGFSIPEGEEEIIDLEAREDPVNEIIRYIDQYKGSDSFDVAVELLQELTKKIIEENFVLGPNDYEVLVQKFCKMMENQSDLSDSDAFSLMNSLMSVMDYAKEQEISNPSLEGAALATSLKFITDERLGYGPILDKIIKHFGLALHQSCNLEEVNSIYDKVLSYWKTTPETGEELVESFVGFLWHNKNLVEVMNRRTEDSFEQSFVKKIKEKFEDRVQLFLADMVHFETKNIAASYRQSKYLYDFLSSDVAAIIYHYERLGIREKAIKILREFRKKVGEQVANEKLGRNGRFLFGENWNPLMEKLEKEDWRV